MKNFVKLSAFICVSLCLILFSCNQNKSSETPETILKGEATVFVDETLTPIVEDQVAVFESEYQAKIKLQSKSEAETVLSLVNAKGGIAIMARDLSAEELKVFRQRKIKPKVTPFATDAIAFVANKNTADTLVALQDVISFMKGQNVNGIKGLVFDNPNSSTVRFLLELAGLKDIPQTGIFSFKTNDEVIKHVAANDGLIGIVGVNWLSQPKPAMKQYIENLVTLRVKGLKGDGYYLPSQNDIAEKKYPLARDLYIINCQGYSGLGMGFASFVGGDIGQRIVLKSGLLPIRIPTRKFTITNNQKDDK
ncbi:MAG: PstS family phosphate ABC transporter substrate-binding protein [Flavobacterium sp.]